MKIIYSTVLLVMVVAVAALLWSTLNKEQKVQEPVATKIVDWDQWYQTRSANMKDHIANAHYSKGGPITPETADAYLEAFEKEPWSLYSEFLPGEEYRKVTQHFLDDFPIVDLNSRLAYEDRKGVRSKHSRKHRYWLSSIAKQLHKNWNDEHYELSVQDREHGMLVPDLKWIVRSRHHRALEVLHRDRLEAFARQDSFGFQRIRDISMEDLHTQERESDYITPQLSELANQRHYSLTADELKAFPKEMHLRNYFNFGADMAYALEFRKARGHISHSIYRMMTPDSLQLKSLELVSLLKYDAPRVYVSDHFPDMKLLSKAKTRDLDSFETSALKKLFEGEFVVVDESTSRMQVLGAVHAGETCIECHAVKQGELLGAFSYKFDQAVSQSLTLNP